MFLRVRLPLNGLAKYFRANTDTLDLTHLELKWDLTGGSKWVFGGYFPREWPLKLALIMGVSKTLFKYLSEFTIEDLQKLTAQKNPGFKEDGLWIIPVPTIPNSEETVDRIVSIINTALTRLGKISDEFLLKPEDIVDLSAEWVGIKCESSLKEDTQELNDREKFEKMTHEAESDKVILHCHGGGFMCVIIFPMAKVGSAIRYLIDLSAKFSLNMENVVFYHSAPQTRWPKPLADVLLAYSYLLYPPSDALHPPIPPSKIIFSGDSSGGGLVLTALLALHVSKESSLPPPAGLISLSGCLDASFSSGLTNSQTPWDIAVNPHETTVYFKPSPAIPELKLENAHPCLPELDLAMHPLSSPILCPEEVLSDLPPMLMMMSNGEFFYKEFMYFVGRVVANQGVIQAFVHEDTPHVFPMYGFPEIPTFRESFREIGEFIGSVGGLVERRAERVWWDGTRVSISEEEYIRISRDELVKRMELSVRNLEIKFTEFMRRNPKYKYVTTPVA